MKTLRANIYLRQLGKCELIQLGDFASWDDKNMIFVGESHFGKFPNECHEGATFWRIEQLDIKTN